MCNITKATLMFQIFSSILVVAKHLQYDVQTSQQPGDHHEMHVSLKYAVKEISNDL